MGVDLKYIDIDRTIYEQLRQKTVVSGYLPNIINYPSTVQGKSNWLNDRKNTEISKGFIVDVFGVGASMDRGELITCRIIVSRLESRNGNITSSMYEPSDLGFRRLVTKYSRDITYEVRIIARTAEQEQLLNDIVESAFSGTQKWILVNSGRNLQSNAAFLISRENDYNVGAYDHIERRYTYSVQDVFIDTGNDEAITIVPINTIYFTVLPSESIITLGGNQGFIDSSINILSDSDAILV